jgi:hypothetical protein
VLLEAGIMNTTWFECDDESITTADDIELRLDRIMVRSCSAGPISSVRGASDGENSEH